MNTRTLASGTVVQVDDRGRVIRPSDTAGSEYHDPCQTAHSECECGGSGLFYCGGGVVNGKYTGRTGTCFRCGGKGYQDAGDRKRNYWYDAKYRRIYY